MRVDCWCTKEQCLELIVPCGAPPLCRKIHILEPFTLSYLQRVDCALFIDCFSGLFLQEQIPT